MPDITPPVRWQPDRTPDSPPWPVPPLSVCVGRGVRGLCPACGQTRAFAGYLKVVPECLVCTAPLGQFRADDAPPYFTVLIAGHLIVPLMFMVETSYHPPLWVHAAIWLPVATLVVLGLLRPVKGAVLGWMLRLGLVKSAGE